MSGGSFDAILTNGLASIRGAAEATGNSLGKLRDGMSKLGTVGDKEFRRMGEAISKMGGPLAEVGGKFFGAAGMEGGLRKMALLAVAAGVAMKTLASAIETAEARAQAFANAAAGLRDVERNARAARNAFAAGSEETGRTQAKAENIIGKDAGSRAAMFAKSYGVSQEDALRSFAATAAIPKALRGIVLEAAARVAATGEYTMVEAVQRMTDRATRDRVLGASNLASGIPLPPGIAPAASLLQLMRGGMGAAARAEAINTIGGTANPGPAQARLPGVVQAENITTNGRVDAFTSGATELAKRQEAADAINPEAAALSKWFNALQESQQKQRDLAAATPGFINFLKQFTAQGSAETQRRREIIGAGEALTGTGGD
jgi:hypothetical protein